MKMSDLTKKEFLEFFYSFLLENIHKYDEGDSYEMLEEFIKSFEFEGD